MRIHPAALQRVRNAQFRGEGIGTIFEHQLAMVRELGPPVATLTLNYQSPEDEIEPGDMVPVVILSLQPASKIAKESPAGE